MSRIFISYKRVDKDKVFKIKDQIEAALGEKCWIDLDGIESDAQFALKTLKAIEEATFVLFFYSSASETSQCQRRELEYAIKNHKKVISVLIDEVPDDSWYYNHLSVYQSFRTDNVFEITSVLKAVKKRTQTIQDESYENPCSIKAVHEENFANPSPARFKNIGCISGILGVFLVLVIVSLWMVGGSNSSNSSDNSYAPHSEHEGHSPADTMFRDSVVTGYEEEVDDDTDHIMKDNIVEEETGSCIKYEEKFEFKDIPLLSYAELELEYLRIQYIIDSLKLEKDSERALFHCHKYQYQLQKELYHKKQAGTDVVVFEDEEEHNSDFKSNLWLFLGLPFLAIGIYFIKRRKARTVRKNTEKKSILPETHNVPLFSQPKKIKIFIAGSTRLVAEREALRATISKMYNQHKNDNLVVEAYEFDDFTREYVEGGQQKLYDDFIRNEANWVVFITDGTIGDKTIWELENAINVHKETGHPKILMYSIPQNIIINQKEQMSQFKSILNREDNYWIDYEDVNTIRSTFREHLEWDLINLMKMEMRRVAI